MNEIGLALACGLILRWSSTNAGNGRARERRDYRRRLERTPAPRAQARDEFIDSRSWRVDGK